jgi:hypothetical protein
MPQAHRLIIAAFSRDPVLIQKALADLKYYLKRNYGSYQSHRKKKLELLE